MNGYARGQRPLNVPSMISASVPQIAMARTRQRTSFADGFGTGTRSMLNSCGAVRTSADISFVAGGATVVATTLGADERDHAADATLAADPAPRERADVDAPARDLRELAA